MNYFYQIKKLNNIIFNLKKLNNINKRFLVIFFTIIKLHRESEGIVFLSNGWEWLAGHIERRGKYDPTGTYVEFLDKDFNTIKKS